MVTTKTIGINCTRRVAVYRRSIAEFPERMRTVAKGLAHLNRPPETAGSYNDSCGMTRHTNDSEKIWAKILAVAATY